MSRVMERINPFHTKKYFMRKEAQDMGEFIIGAKSLILHNKKALLVQRSGKSGMECGKWEFTGGKVEFGEDLHTALHREIKEETGLENIRIEKLLYAMTAVIAPEKQIIGLLYLCHANSDAVKISDEHLDFIWANREQLISLLNKNMLNELIENSVLDSLEID